MISWAKVHSSGSGQPGYSEVLALGCSITDFTLATNAQGVFQRMLLRIALIQADSGTALHISIQQPIDDEQGPFDPADFAQCDRKFMLSGIGCKFPQELAWRHRAHHHGCRAAQYICPVLS